MKVEVQSLTRHFGRTKAVDDVSFSFDTGHIVGFVGPNGAGKTTTMRILATLDDPLSGDAFVDGISVTEYPDKVRDLIGFVPDALPTHGDMTVHEYLDFYARAYRLKGAKRRKAVEAVEEFTSLTGLRDKLLNSLSKGMKQRVCLGRALIHDPPVMILDEPAAGLDPRARVELRELLFLLAGQKKAILISSHILTELAEICNAVLIIEKGRLLESGTIADVAKRGDHRTAVIIRPLDRHIELCRELLQLPGVEAARQVGQEVVVDFNGDEERCAGLLGGIIGKGFKIVEFKMKKAGLEDIFMKVTKGGVQ